MTTIHSLPEHHEHYEHHEQHEEQIERPKSWLSFVLFGIYLFLWSFWIIFSIYLIFLIVVHGLCAGPDAGAFILITCVILISICVNCLKLILMTSHFADHKMYNIGFNDPYDVVLYLLALLFIIIWTIECMLINKYGHRFPYRDRNAELLYMTIAVLWEKVIAFSLMYNLSYG